MADLVLVVVYRRIGGDGRVRTAPPTLSLVRPRGLDVEQIADPLESLDAAGFAPGDPLRAL